MPHLYNHANLKRDRMARGALLVLALACCLWKSRLSPDHLPPPTARDRDLPPIRDSGVPCGVSPRPEQLHPCSRIWSAGHHPCSKVTRGWCRSRVALHGRVGDRLRSLQCDAHQRGLGEQCRGRERTRSPRRYHPHHGTLCTMHGGGQGRREDGHTSMCAKWGGNGSHKRRRKSTRKT